MKNILKLNVTRDNSENGFICICGNKDCTDRKCIPSNKLQYVFTNSKKKFGFLTEAVTTSKTMSPRKSIMYSIYRKTTAWLCKLKKQLCDKKTLIQLKTMSDNNIFHNIETKLNKVIKHFI